MSEEQVKYETTAADTTVIEDAISTITKMDKNDEAYKKEKNFNISRLKTLKKAIEDYCDVSEKWNYFLCFGIGLIVGGVVTILFK